MTLRFPEGTPAFWRGEENTGSLKAWEVIACPVVDVQAFLLNPLSCAFGISDEGFTDGLLSDFLVGLKDPFKDAITGVMTDAFIPLSLEAVWNFTGLRWVEDVRTNACINLFVASLYLTRASLTTMQFLRKTCDTVARTIDNIAKPLSLGIYR